MLGKVKRAGSSLIDFNGHTRKFSRLVLSIWGAVLVSTQIGCGPGLPSRPLAFLGGGGGQSSPGNTGPLPQQTNTNADDMPQNLTLADGRLYFTANSGTGLKVFSFDGSTLERISDTNPSGHDNPSKLRAVGSALYFQAYNGVNYKLYLYRPGVTASPIAVSNTHPNEDDEIDILATTPNGIYFTAEDSLGWRKLYRHRLTDGLVTSGSRIANIIDLQPEQIDQTVFTIGERLFFAAQNNMGEKNIYTYIDGDSEVTARAFTTSQTDDDQSSLLGVINNELYFLAKNANTSGGASNPKKMFKRSATGVITEISNTAGSTNDDDASADAFKVLGDSLYFYSTDSSAYYKLYRYNIQSGGAPVLLPETYPGDSDSPDRLTVFGSMLAYTSTWAVDGYQYLTLFDPANPTVVTRIYNGTDGEAIYPERLTVVGDRLYCLASDENGDTAVYSYKRGDPANSLAKVSGLSASNSGSISILGSDADFLFVVGGDVDQNSKIFKIDTNLAVSQFSDTFNTGNDAPESFVQFSGQSFAVLQTGESIRRVFKLSGSTQLDSDSALFRTNSSLNANDDPQFLTVDGDTIYFAANNNLNRQKLYRFKKRQELLEQISNVNSNSTDSIDAVVLFNSDLYFVARGPDSKLYRYSPNASIVTTPAFNLNSGGDDQPSELMVCGGMLYFVATTSNGSDRAVYAINSSRALFGPFSGFGQSIEDLECHDSVVTYWGYSGGFTKVFMHVPGDSDSVQISNSNPGGNDRSASNTIGDPLTITKNFARAPNGDIYYAATSNGTTGSRHIYRYVPGGPIPSAPIADSATATIGSAHFPVWGLDSLFFNARISGAGFKLFRFDPNSPSALIQVSNSINLGEDSPVGVMAVGSRFYFRSRTSAGSFNPRVFSYEVGDAVPLTTTVHCVNCGGGSDDPKDFALLDGLLYFFGQLDGGLGRRLFSLSSGQGVPTQVTSFEAAPISDEQPIFKLDSKLYIIGSEAGYPEKLYSSSGGAFSRRTNHNPGFSDGIWTIQRFPETNKAVYTAETCGGTGSGPSCRHIMFEE